MPSNPAIRRLRYAERTGSPLTNAERQQLFRDRHKGTRRSAVTGECSICHNVTSLVIDHCHDSGLVRGFICHSCNSMLGFAHDNCDTLAEAITYLRNPPLMKLNLTYGSGSVDDGVTDEEDDDGDDSSGETSEVTGE